MPSRNLRSRRIIHCHFAEKTRSVSRDKARRAALHLPGLGFTRKFRRSARNSSADGGGAICHARPATGPVVAVASYRASRGTSTERSRVYRSSADNACRVRRSNIFREAQLSNAFLVGRDPILPGCFRGIIDQLSILITRGNRKSVRTFSADRIGAPVKPSSDEQRKHDVGEICGNL